MMSIDGDDDCLTGAYCDVNDVDDCRRYRMISGYKSCKLGQPVSDLKMSIFIQIHRSQIANL